MDTQTIVGIALIAASILYMIIITVSSVKVRFYECNMHVSKEDDYTQEAIKVFTSRGYNFDEYRIVRVINGVSLPHGRYKEFIFKKR